MLISAPMAGVTDYPWRQLVREVAGDSAQLIYTEMISAKAVCMRNTRTIEMLPKSDEAVVVQLFGSEPRAMAQACVRIMEQCPKVIGFDINAGCPVRKVIKTGSGSALMNDPERIRRMIREMRPILSDCKKTLSIKTRLGWRKVINFPEIGMIAQEEGADWFTLHGRTVEQGYSGQADLAALRLLSPSLRIPIHWSGDVFTVYQAVDRLQDPKIQGVLFARGMMGNPWIFPQTHALCGEWSGLRSGAQKNGAQESDASMITSEERIRTVQRHMQLTDQSYGASRALAQFKKWVAPYSRFLSDIRHERNELMRMTDWQTFQDRFLRLLEFGFGREGSSDFPLL